MVCCAWREYLSLFVAGVVRALSVEAINNTWRCLPPRSCCLIGLLYCLTFAALCYGFPFSQIPTWGHSGSSFVLHIGNLLKQTKLYFQTNQGKEINDLVRAYVNHLCA